MNQERDDIVILRDEDGNEVKFEYLDTITYKDEDYVVLFPLEDEEDEAQVVILQLEKDGDDMRFLPVENEDDLQTVFMLFQEEMKDMFDFGE